MTADLILFLTGASMGFVLGVFVGGVICIVIWNRAWRKAIQAAGEGS